VLTTFCSTNQDGLKVEKRQFTHTPVSFNAIAQGEPFRISGWTWYLQNLESFGLSVGEEIIVRFDTISDCDRQMDKRTDVGLHLHCRNTELAQLAMLRCYHAGV